MKHKMLVAGTILMLAATSALKAENVSDDHRLKFDQPDYYRAGELSVDVFGAAALGKYSIEHLSRSRVRQGARLGAGVGLNFFFTRHVGIGVDAYSEDTHGNFVDSASANLILRLPLGQSGFAPYAFVGGGHQFDLAELSFAQAGAGIEYRFTPHVGIFTDARGVLPDKTKYFGIARIGLRFAF